PAQPERIGDAPHASPAVRRFARELGADLARMRGRGPKGRILKSDVRAWVKQQLSAAPAPAAASGIPPIPAIDFSQFGTIETVPLSRIKKLSGPHLQRAWLNAPHVTHHDDADITELEAFRQSLKAEAEKEGVRVTLLGFAIKALAQALKKFPAFNASLHPDGENLIVKKYYNIGIAVDTPSGLVVPVIRNVERKTIFELAREMADLSARARNNKLKIADLQGGCISISSLGGIGGAAFTPIVNAPEAAILGITRARMAPVWDGAAFQPRLLLPLDLSYDHRVIDGAEAARFVAYLLEVFGDVRRLSL
ncbi:MAG: 2-oxo acid dehydrogenase subunit E2, partial [Gammaproteobacteria bacterium]